MPAAIPPAAMVENQGYRGGHQSLEVWDPVSSAAVIPPTPPKVPLRHPPWAGVRMALPSGEVDFIAAEAAL
jgi:hypothetical protein